ncbi:hypothetical protein KFE25_003119 [Diacronema lutheri]|uniref:fructose-bisphosphate aldolase n=2 Tax=Diacronema lutheri TaxID=2081491 RepID=A0A8J6C2D2_DIALT|nr:hypothetical protein KFE25_003119 [Diacronema lutheri]
MIGILIAALAFRGGGTAGGGARHGSRVAMRVTPAGSNGAHLSVAQKAELAEIARLVARPGKGLTACDEGPLTVGARFEKVGITNSEETRRAYRQMLFETPGAEQYLSGAILDPETLYQKSSTSGDFFPQVLSDRGIVPGVKPHLKVYALPGCGGETVMQGLDSLAARCAEYRKAGARFAKWRSPLEIRDGQISRLAIEANMHDLARYALICQAEGLMPIVEPDISLAGDYDLETAVRLNVEVQAELYKAMIDHGVYMEGATLKPNMVNPGKACTTKYTCEQIGQANIDVLSRVFPCAMPGANFLSGGQSLENAAARLSAINKAKGGCPWNLSFSWSQALQLPLMELCKGTGELQLEAMSELYLSELKIAGAAALGQYEPPLPGAGDHKPPAPRVTEVAPSPPPPPVAEKKPWWQFA